MRAGSPSSCVCTACSSTPRLAAACPCGRPPMRGRLSAPEPPGPLNAAQPPTPASSGGPPDSPRSRLQQRTDSERCSETRFMPTIQSFLLIRSSNSDQLQLASSKTFKRTYKKINFQFLVLMTEQSVCVSL